MRDQHAKVHGPSVRFEFRGKSRIEHAVDLRDARLARIVKACRDLPGYELFQYVGADRKRQIVDSADVNAYLGEISGEDFTAKDFRTWPARCWRQRHWPVSRSFGPPRRRSGTSGARSSRWQNVWAIRKPSVASATCIPRF